MSACRNRGKIIVTEYYFSTANTINYGEIFSGDNSILSGELYMGGDNYGTIHANKFINIGELRNFNTIFGSWFFSVFIGPFHISENGVLTTKRTIVGLKNYGRKEVFFHFLDRENKKQILKFSEWQSMCDITNDGEIIINPSSQRGYFERSSFNYNAYITAVNPDPTIEIGGQPGSGHNLNWYSLESQSGSLTQFGHLEFMPAYAAPRNTGTILFGSDFESTSQEIINQGGKIINHSKTPPIIYDENTTYIYETEPNGHYDFNWKKKPLS